MDLVFLLRGWGRRPRTRRHKDLQCGRLPVRTAPSTAQQVRRRTAPARRRRSRRARIIPIRGGGLVAGVKISHVAEHPGERDQVLEHPLVGEWPWRFVAGIRPADHFERCRVEPSFSGGVQDEPQLQLLGVVTDVEDDASPLPFSGAERTIGHVDKGTRLALGPHCPRPQGSGISADPVHFSADVGPESNALSPQFLSGNCLSDTAEVSPRDGRLLADLEAISSGLWFCVCDLSRIALRLRERLQRPGGRWTFGFVRFKICVDENWLHGAGPDHSGPAERKCQRRSSSSSSRSRRTVCGLLPKASHAN